MTTTTFVHVPQPSEHPGVARATSVIEAARQIDGARSLAALLLAAIVSALLVAADMLVDAWAEGHLLAAWVLLWVLGFAGLALLSGTVRRFSVQVMAELNAWSARVAQRRADERLWAIAQTDARVMAELQTALAREDATPTVRLTGKAQRAHDMVRREAYYL